MGTTASTAMALTVIAAALLLGFGIRQALSAQSRKRGLLMIACGIVFLGNVMIWTL